jgi:hypothetical protein
MKNKALIFLFLFFFLTGFHTQAQRHGQMHQKIMDIAQKYSPDSYYLLNEYYKLPREYQSGGYKIRFGKPTDMTGYLKGNSQKDIVNSLNTIVHEICHSYTFIAAHSLLNETQQSNSFTDNSYSALYINPEETILLRHTDVFVSRKMQTSIPKEMRTQRFSTYIRSIAPNLGSQKNGVYGLLDEWNAYYQGTRTTLELYDYYQEKSREDHLVWLDFFADFSGTYFAHLEFKYFILKYLFYAKENYSEVYKNIMQNNSFIKAYCAIDSHFSQLIEKYLQQKKEIIKELNAQGHQAYESDEFTYIGSVGQGNFSDTYQKLETELKKKPYQNMEQLIYKSL